MAGYSEKKKFHKFIFELASDFKRHGGSSTTMFVPNISIASVYV